MCYNFVMVSAVHNVNQLCIYIYPLSRASLQFPTSHHSRSSEHQAQLPVVYNSFPPPTYNILYMVVSTRQPYSLHLSHAPHLCSPSHMSILYICVSSPALEISLCVPFFLDSTYMLTGIPRIILTGSQYVIWTTLISSAFLSFLKYIYSANNKYLACVRH